MSGIFSTDPKITPCIYGKIRVFKNSEIKPEQLNLIHTLDPYYVPRCNFPDNLTLIHPETKTIVQVDTNLTLFDVILPTDQDKYKELMFTDTVNYIITTLRHKIPYTVVNEAGYKISFYAPINTPASNSNWWDSTGITKMDWKPRGNRNMSTLALSLGSPYQIYTLYISVDAEYMLIKNPENNIYNNVNTNISSTPYFQTPTNTPFQTPSTFSWANSQQNSKVDNSSHNPSTTGFPNNFQIGSNYGSQQSTQPSIGSNNFQPLSGSNNGFQFSSTQPSIGSNNGFQPPTQPSNTGFQFSSTQPSIGSNNYQPPSGSNNAFQFSSTQPSIGSNNAFQFSSTQPSVGSNNGFQFSSTQPSVGSNNGLQFSGVNPFLPTKKW